MTLCDAGPLIAIIDADEPDHDACLATVEELALPLVTTWPAFTEAMYLLGQAGGIVGQRALWSLIHTGRLILAELSEQALARSAQLMGKYADRPMDLADATLVACAEAEGHRKIFSLDSDFQVYRINGRQRFEVVPQR
jgi:hypothetical protein